jgi:hypothetical protein
LYITSITPLCHLLTKNFSDGFRWSMTHIGYMRSWNLNDGIYGVRSGFSTPVTGVCQIGLGMGNKFVFDEPYVVDGGTGVEFEINEVTATLAATIIVEGVLFSSDKLNPEDNGHKRRRNTKGRFEKKTYNTNFKFNR